MRESMGDPFESSGSRPAFVPPLEEEMFETGAPEVEKTPEAERLERREALLRLKEEWEAVTDGPISRGKDVSVYREGTNRTESGWRVMGYEVADGETDADDPREKEDHIVAVLTKDGVNGAYQLRSVEVHKLLEMNTPVPKNEIN